MTGLVILPQALTLVIPGIVNNFIGLFKDTTLVSIVGLVDFLGAVENAFKDTVVGRADHRADRLCLRRAVLFRILLRDVALSGLHGAPARRRATLRRIGRSP